MNERVLIVEDEPRVQKFIAKGLTEAGMNIEVASSIREAFNALPENEFDIIILDRLLGRDDSLARINEFKRLYPKLKLLILSALHSFDQIAQGLDEGADDYLAKPFHIRELVSRIRNLCRRSQILSCESKILSFFDLKMNLATQKVFRGSHLIFLSFQEFKILKLMIESPDRIISRSELLASVWDLHFDPESNVVDVTIGRLRKKINISGFTPLIHSRRGVGYSLSNLGTNDDQ